MSWWVLLITKCVWAVFGGSILYLAGRIITTRAQHKGIGTLALDRALDHLEPSYLCTITRNPSVPKMISKSTGCNFADIYPFSDGKDLPLIDMAEMADVPQESLPFHDGRYPKGGLLGEAPPEAGDVILASVFNSNLPLETGVLLGVKL